MQLKETDQKIPSIGFSETDFIHAECNDCGLCKKECGFLGKYGTPGKIKDRYLAFECSLCGLCGAVCPVGIDPTLMFLEMRKQSVACGQGEWPEHKGLVNYERIGTSKRYTWYALPENCDTVFFPGCSLPGTRPDTTFKLYEHLKKNIPNLGIVLDCCTKPSHDLGKEEFFNAIFGELRDYLILNKIKNVLVACPNCYNVFKEYGGSLEVKTVYQLMADISLPESKRLSGLSVTIHDPCVLRYDSLTQNAVRKLVSNHGIQVREMEHSREKTLCCGEGGAVASIAPGLSGSWRELRKKEAGDQMIITYCAGCTGFLGREMAVAHIADLVFDPENTVKGKVKPAKAPFTYFNRLRLKRKFKSKVDAAVFRERLPYGNSHKKTLQLKLLLLVLVVAGFIIIRSANIQAFFDQEALRGMIEGYGMVAPLIYMAIYALAPVLFLPALPITMAGGILFGPFWGVVYSIIGATTGASLSFLISRYFARSWVESKLTNPRWRKLDSEVAKNGWKVVAFTRLIPLFPFNLLNYGFGLTSIRFLHYAGASFIFMLPGCIGFIVFSSSLTDLVMGKISMEFVLGLAIIALVSLLPFFLRKFIFKK